MARLALIGCDDQLYVADPRHGGRLQLTSDPTPQLWGVSPTPPSTWSWPSWSPDGTRIACFELDEDDQDTGPARVHVVHTDGVRQWHCLDVEHGVPLYVQWQPDGEGLLVLVQDGEELELQHIRLDRLGHASSVERGLPLFFTWHPDGERVVVHTASSSESRLVVRDVSGRLPDEVLPQRPANYCAPIFQGDRLIHVDAGGGTNQLVSTDDTGADAQVLLEFEGLGALLRTDDAFLFSAAPDGEGKPYRGLLRIGQELEPVSGEHCLAFFPRGEDLVLVQVDTENNCLTWQLVVAGETRELCRFWPSREQLFHLRFFDQFAPSHRLLSPDGRRLVFCGHPLDTDEQRDEPSVLVYDLERHELRDLGPGAFACFSPVENSTTSEA
ncbi:MAG: hypothetical protein GY913_18670 [Proteobacteria bacterium]|nr:hypothetical protein [Pseudomonadota bacterium]MCP4918934.1 hypothetical protein [Pseudomonadota bacterium]